MKILLIGLIAFIGWSALSTYIYVCKIKGLCDEPTSIQMHAVKSPDAKYPDNLKDTIPVKHPLDEQVLTSENLIIYFDFDKSEFQSNAETGNFIKETKVYLNQNSKARITITGHTCAIGTNEYNQDLGYRRAKSILNYFAINGISENKILINSKGESEPAADNNTVSGRANNRRSEIVIKK